MCSSTRRYNNKYLLLRQVVRDYLSGLEKRNKLFVYCSSMARYGTQEKVPFTEDMIPLPQDPYGISKLSAKQLLHCLCKVHGMELAIAVLHNIIGPRQKYDDPYSRIGGKSYSTEFFITSKKKVVI